MTFANYISLIKAQQKNYPNHPKYYQGIINTNINKTAAETLEELLITPSAKYSNTFTVNRPLYSDTKELSYLEFIDTSIVNNGSLDSWKYYYIPLYLKEELELTKLPYITRYDAKISTVDKIYPFTPFLFRYTRPVKFNFIQPLQNNRHPFASNFIFTGHYFINSNSKAIYEYIDFNQFSDYIEVPYASNIAPTNFNLPSTHAELTTNDNYVGLINKPPSKLEWSNNFVKYSFTGQTTTEYFNKNKLWFEYISINIGRFNLGVSEAILLPDAPINKDLSFVDYELGKRIKTNIANSVNEQLLKYKQTSNNKRILIKQIIF